MRNTRVLFRCLLLLAFLPLFAVSPARGNNCPVFSWPNSADTIKVTYGKCPLAPATATITTPGYPNDHSQWEIVALNPFNPASCPAAIVPMPAWISFEPSSGLSTPALSIKMTIDPTKGGGSVTLDVYEQCGSLFRPGYTGRRFSRGVDRPRLVRSKRNPIHTRRPKWYFRVRLRYLDRDHGYSPCKPGQHEP